MLTGILFLIPEGKTIILMKEYWWIIGFFLGGMFFNLAPVW
jgi:hypothetical protein